MLPQGGETETKYHDVQGRALPSAVWRWHFPADTQMQVIALMDWRDLPCYGWYSIKGTKREREVLTQDGFRRSETVH